MVGVFAFPAKPENKDYPYYKTPKKVLEIEDSDVLLLSKQKGCGSFVHWMEDWDELSDKEIIEKVNQFALYSYSISSRKSGQGYNSEDKTKYIRIVRQKYYFFKDRLI